jgi:hypothetical protein
MLYPATRLDQLLHRLPGGDALAHQIGRLGSAFGEAAQADETKRLKARVLEDIKPITDRLAAIPPDANGRRWRSDVRTAEDWLSGGPEITVTFGHFNDAEYRAFLYFQRNGGMPVYPANGLKWGAVDARSYSLDIPAGRGGGRPIYRGYLPGAEPDRLDMKASHKIGRFARYFLETALPQISARADRPAPKAGAPLP